jgi:hypothetical protein
MQREDIQSLPLVQHVCAHNVCIRLGKLHARSSYGMIAIEECTSGTFAVPIIVALVEGITQVAE